MASVDDGECLIWAGDDGRGRLRGCCCGDVGAFGDVCSTSMVEGTSSRLENRCEV